MKKLNVLMIKRITWGLITLLMLAGCSLNNPFLQTEEPIPPAPEKPEELPPPPPEPIHVESITSDVTKVTREIGGDYRIVYKILPENADDKSVVIKIESMTPENETVVSLKDGVVYALALGEAVVSITTNDGNKVAKINFTVIPKDPDTVDVEKITIEGVDWIYDDGERKPLIAIVEPQDATDKSLRWSIVEEENIAKIESQDASGSGISIWRDGEVTEETVVTVRVESSYKSAIFAEKKVTIKHKPRPEIIITSPNGGEEFTFKTDTTITWTTKDIESDNVKVELIDTLTGNEYLIADNVSIQGGGYWHIDTEDGYDIGENYKIRVTTIPNADESADVVFVDESDEVFKLSKVVPTIELTRPTKETIPEEGVPLYSTSSISIDWLSTDMEKDNVSLYLVKNDGTLAESIAENIPNTGSYVWQLPDDKNEWDDGSEYKIKIYRYDVEQGKIDEEIFSESSIDFALKKADNPFLKFIGPSVPYLYIGAQNNILWQGVELNTEKDEKVYLKIELVPEDPSVSNYVITERTENVGRYEWKIPESILLDEENIFTSNTNYKIRISTLKNDIRYKSGDRMGELVDRMVDLDGNPILDGDGKEVVLENSGTLVVESLASYTLILAPNVYFLLDDSASMAYVKNPTRTEVLKKRMDNAAVALATNFNVGIEAMNAIDVRLEMKMVEEKESYAAEIRSSYARLGASGGTPINTCLKRIREEKRYEIKDDVYNKIRRKAVVVITDGMPGNAPDTIKQSTYLALEGIPVFYMGINIGSQYFATMQDMAVAGGADNKSDPDKNWYPIDTDEQFETALNYILYSDMDVAGSLVRYEIDCGTPDSGNHIYFYGKHALLGNTTSPTSASGLLKGTYENGKYYIKIGKQDNMTFDWGVVQADSKGNILKIEKPSLHSSDVTSTTFNGWDENVIIIKVKQALGYSLIHYWNCSNKTSYPNTSFPGVKMTSSGDDYVFTFVGTTSVELLITKADHAKLCGSDMKASSPGTWRVTSSGIKKEN